MADSPHDRLWQHEQMRRDLERHNGRPVFLPMMSRPQPDTAERTRFAVQAIAFALPPKKDQANG